MSFRVSVPNQSRPSSNYEILFDSGGPGENRPWSSTACLFSLSNIGIHSVIVLFKQALLLCSQRQTKTFSDNIRQASVPNQSRLLRRFHSQKSSWKKSILPSAHSYAILNSHITTTSRRIFGGRHAEHFHSSC